MNAFIPVDIVLQDIESRFTDHHHKALALQALLPKHAKEANWDSLKNGWEKYRSLLPNTSEKQLQAEFRVWCAMWQRKMDQKENLSAITALNKCSVDVYPNIHILLSILAVLPVSTAETERMFSKVERTMTSLRSTMGEERLEALILLEAHRASLPATDEVIKYFGQSGVRRLDFVYPL